MTTQTIDDLAGADVFDVRNVIERFEELETDTAGDPDEQDEDRLMELEDLKELLSEVEGNGGDHEWRGSWYPVTFIRDSYFTDYAEELCKDIGDIPDPIPHYIVIDWEATAANIRQDYSSVEFKGETYWYR